MGQRSQYGALGQGIEILWPGFVVADYGDFKRRYGQRFGPS